jgi:hypothetical protein
VQSCGARNEEQNVFSSNNEREETLVGCGSEPISDIGANISYLECNDTRIMRLLAETSSMQQQLSDLFKMQLGEQRWNDT